MLIDILLSAYLVNKHSTQLIKLATSMSS